MRRIARRLGLAGMLVACSLAGIVGTQAASSPSPQTQQGIGGMAPPPPGLQQGNQPTLQERYPWTSYTPFHLDVGAVVKNTAVTMDPTTQALNVWASDQAGEVMDGVLMVGYLTSALVEWAFSIDVVADAGGPLSRVVQRLATQIYDPLLGAVLALVGIWLVWHMLLRRRTLMGLEGAAWAGLALVMGGLYIAAPVQLMSGANDLTGQLSRGMLGAIGTADPQLANRGSDPTLSQGDAADAELRLVVDRYWRTFVFVPWCMAEFGDVSPTGQRLGEELLAKQSNQQTNFDANLQKAPQDQDWYNGSRGGDRLAVVSMALLIILISSVLYALIAGAVVVSQLGLLILLMVAPLFLLVGVHPGTGRRLLGRFAELAAATLVMRVLAGALLAVVMVLSDLAMELGGGNWWLQAALQVGLLVTALIYRKPFLRVFGQVASVGAARPQGSHVSHPGRAEATHRFLDRRSMEVWREVGRGRAGLPGSGPASGARALASGKGAAGPPAKVAGKTAGGTGSQAGATAGTGGKVAMGISTAGLALVALEAGKLGVRGVAHGVRKAQGASGRLLLDGGGQVPPAPRIPRASRGLGEALGQVRQPKQALEGHAEKAEGHGAGRRDGRRRSGEGQSPKGRNYTNWRSGETVNVVSSKIVLPGSWQRVRSEKRS